MHCRVCGRILKSKESIDKGIGPGCEKKLLMADKKNNADHAADIEKYLGMVEGDMDKCDKCGRKIRFIGVKGDKPLIVDAKSFYFIPYAWGENFITTSGDTRRGVKARDGITGYSLHKCR